MHTIFGSDRAAYHRAAWREDLHTTPSDPDTGQSYVGAAGSRVGSADHVVTRSALDADGPASDDRPVAGSDDPQPRSDLDLDDVSRCPLAPGCESCDAVDDLAVGTAECLAGVLCVTLCTSCAEAGDVPEFPSASAVIARVGEHAVHLGTDLDGMAAAWRR